MSADRDDIAIAADIGARVDNADIVRVGGSLYAPISKIAAALAAAHYMPRPPHPDTGEWCQGAKFPQHVYQGDEVVAMFIDPDQAREAVQARNAAWRARQQ